MVDEMIELSDEHLFDEFRIANEQNRFVKIKNADPSVCRRKMINIYNDKSDRLVVYLCLQHTFHWQTPDSICSADRQWRPGQKSL